MPTLPPDDLTLLRRDAKRLARSVVAGDAVAFTRVRTHVPLRTPFPFADALHVVAREHGFEDWPDLTLAARLGSATAEDRIVLLERALHAGNARAVRHLRDAGVGASDDLGLAVALFDVDAVTRWLDGDPGATGRMLRRRSLIAHLAFSTFAMLDPDARAERERASLAMAHLLVSRGASVNDSVTSEADAQHPLSVLYGALAHARNVPLARWLLEHGADPNDGESLYHATESSGADAVALLLRYGARIEGTNALLRAVDVGNVAAVETLLAAGADPDAVVVEHPSGEPMASVTPLQHAALRDGRTEITAALLAAGADPTRTWNGRDAYATARIAGSRAVARTLAEAGYASPLTEKDVAMAQCADGVPLDEPMDVTRLSEVDHRLPLRVAARPGGAPHLAALLASGWDPLVRDEMDMSILHVGVWEGLPETVALALAHGADLMHVNGYGGDAVDTLLHGADACPEADHRDHVACARLLLAAGARMPSEEDRIGRAHEELVAWFEDVAEAASSP